jgi:hypothetical protein
MARPPHRAVARVALCLVASLALFSASSAVAQTAPAPLAPPTAEGAPPFSTVAPPPVGDAAPAQAVPPASDASASVPVAPAAASAAPAIPVPTLPRCVVIDAAPYGVDPVVGRYVSQAMRTTAAQLGYDVLTPAQSVEAAQRVRMTYPPAPADLWRATWAAGAARGAFARVWAYRGEYVIEITVASADGGGPFFARGSAPAAQLVAMVERLTREALPPPGVSTAPGALPTPGVAPVPGTPAGPSANLDDGDDEASATPRRRRRGRARRWVFAARTDFAFGASRDFFFNALLGARIDYRITPDIRVGAYLGYANLRGKDGRASNLLMLAQVEDRVRVSASTDLRVPLRLALGYLPQNGPVVRLAAGLGFPIGNRWEMTFDLLAPTFWVLPERTVVSLDLAAELGYRF